MVKSVLICSNRYLILLLIVELFLFYKNPQVKLYEKQSVVVSKTNKFVYLLSLNYWKPFSWSLAYFLDLNAVRRIIDSKPCEESENGIMNVNGEFLNQTSQNQKG